jgi:hypothetical protein
MHSGEQKVANPDLRFIARSAGIQVPQLSQRTNLFLDGVLCGADEVNSVATVSELAIF